jgi:putative addiction module component (TIGR02574 family)
LADDAAIIVEVEEETQTKIRSTTFFRRFACRIPGRCCSCSSMSKVEILNELPTLTPEERQEVRELLADLDDEDWLDDGELSDGEKALIDARLDECEGNPSSFIPWDEAKARINASLKKDRAWTSCRPHFRTS